MSLDENVPTSISKPIEQPIEKPTQNNWQAAPQKQAEPENEKVSEPFLKQADDTQKEQTEINWSFTSESAKSEQKEVKDTAEKPEEKEEVVRHYLTDDLEERVEIQEVKPKSALSPEEQQQRAKERMERIQAYTAKLKSSSGISDLEKEPAYKRKNVQIDEKPHSSEENMSKYTLDNNEDGGIELRGNNSFLHDNVD